MKTSTLWKLYAKSFCRQHFFYYNLLIYLLYAAIGISAFVYLFKMKNFLESVLSLLLPQQAVGNGCGILILCFVSLLLTDIVLKFALKKDNYPFKELILVQKSYRPIALFYVFKELFSIWNVYLTLLALVFVKDSDISFALLILINVYMLQIFASQLVCFLNRRRNSLIIFASIISFLLVILYAISIPAVKFPDSYLNIAILTATILALFNIFLFKINIGKSKYFLENSSAASSTVLNFKVLYSTINISYMALNLKMNYRVPVLKRINLMALALTVLYIYILMNKAELVSFFYVRFFVIAAVFSIYPLLINQYLFSAESSFFDNLTLRPSFRQYMVAIYRKYIFISLLFLAPVLLADLSINRIFELISIYLYCMGPVLLLSFCSIFFINSGLDLFGANKMVIPPTGQSLFVVLSFIIPASIVVIITILISEMAALIFMFAAGTAAIIYSGRWFGFILKVFNVNKYKFLDIFRNI